MCKRELGHLGNVGLREGHIPSQGHRHPNILPSPSLPYQHCSMQIVMEIYFSCIIQTNTGNIYKLDIPFSFFVRREFVLSKEIGYIWARVKLESFGLDYTRVLLSLSRVIHHSKSCEQKNGIPKFLQNKVEFNFEYYSSSSSDSSSSIRVPEINPSTRF